MTSRRPQGKSYAEVVASPSTQKNTSSDVTPAVPSDVIFKLLAFTAAMVIAPIGMYFLTVESIFRGSATYAGITAAVTANVVLFAYIYVAYQEDKGEREAENEKKGQ
ncbi:hypothetical protein ASPWEDRAFT_552057 [Aspergillus wentii DTO 134E9]|uniref:Uncharacterized protein n=1 Tax=Aspergillus wentii DTO 134E9 TaxID=1073089 RepID=A0A1L9RGB9_ASPWE|nr:uncharacterized protein ASPWEDRAFT_552057 [Aspergillus wentii DTO 134E9]KAI9927756.1 vacuolar ATPase assembly integral membrane protein vma21 [Aspergillus wentii]OJJ33971.1 hypothetical protein ASPWEDRAFT_552057 [Aspergillus wentii DTO 134E9]